MMRRGSIVWVFLGLVLGACSSEPAAPERGNASGEAPPESALAPERTPGRETTILVYNVENLFDIDGVALFEDYQVRAGDGGQEAGYSHRHLRTKLRNLAAVVQSINDGKGPDIILFQEFEGDQTPPPMGILAPGEDLKVVRLLRAEQGVSVSGILAEEERITDAQRDWPAYWWVALCLDEAGLSYPYVVSADYQPPPNADEGPVHANAVFSRFPITGSRTHPLMKARSILEVEVDVDGHPLLLFNNHWKSGAGSAEDEVIRIQNALVLRERLDEVLAADRRRDVIVGGDFNSHYNQRWLFPDWPRTAINDVLGSQGDEMALREAQSPDLYNLWYELPFEERGSELYQGRWGTLMQMMVTPGLHDRRGLQYIDQSFRVVKIPGRNMDGVLGAPRRWVAMDEGAGYSDHFPILARLRTVAEEGEGFMALENPSRVRQGPDRQPEGDFAKVDLARAVDIATFGRIDQLTRGENLGTLIRASGTVRDGPRIMLETGIGLIELWIPDPDYRRRFKQRFGEGGEVRLTGFLGWYRGRWQIELAHPSWGPSI